mgnify:CR=1 FL=1
MRIYGNLSKMAETRHQTDASCCIVQLVHILALRRQHELRLRGMLNSNYEMETGARPDRLASTSAEY